MNKSVSYIFAPPPGSEELEKRLLEQLREIDARYKAEAAPIIEKLTQLQAMKTPFVAVSDDE